MFINNFYSFQSHFMGDFTNKEGHKTILTAAFIYLQKKINKHLKDLLVN